MARAGKREGEKEEKRGRAAEEKGEKRATTGTGIKGEGKEKKSGGRRGHLRERRKKRSPHPTHNESSARRLSFALTLTRRVRVPLSPQGRGEKMGCVRGSKRKKGVRPVRAFKGGEKKRAAAKS